MKTETRGEHSAYSGHLIKETNVIKILTEKLKNGSITCMFGYSFYTV